MSIDKNHSEQFERYLKGEMSPEESHVFERTLLDDPFAQEALEGYEAMDDNTIYDVEKLKTRILSGKKKPFPWMRIAAAVALLVMGSFTVFYFTDNIHKEQLAMEKEAPEEVTQSSPAPDTVSLPKKTDQLIEEDEAQGIKEIPNDETAPIQTDEQYASFEEEEVEELKADKIETEVEESLADAQASVDTEAIELDISDDDLAVRGRASAVQAVSANDIAPKVILDSSQLEEVVVTTQPLELEQNFLGNSISVVDDDKTKKAKKSETDATQRSLVETISGIITDDTGEPLPGVNVVIKGTTTGVTTDLDGIFELPKDNNQTLVVSYVGFESQEIEVGGRSYIDVVLGGATELQEVVITGYGGAKDDAPSFTPAKPSNGNRAFKKYIEENLNYPEAAKANKIQGTVVLELTIDASGDINNIVVKKSIGFGCDEEAIRLIEDGPRWNGAERNGNTVEDKVKVRVKFKLDR